MKDLKRLQRNINTILQSKDFKDDMKKYFRVQERLWSYIRDIGFE